ncbi:MAG: peptidoglycan endopeptidase [Treponemataceae bacterium]|nr:peptidoglycan endopeptidase [Treponemataceae bacterium]
MLLEWNILMETEKKQCGKMSEADKFRYFLMLQYRSPYGWGKENPMTADCSGSVCLALMMATGLKVRTTADGLLRKFFTVRSPGKDALTAAFFIARSDRRHGDRVARKGEAVHVAGLLGEGVVFNCVEPCAEIRTLESLRLEYGFRGCDVIIRGLDREALEKASKEGNELFGLDDELKDYFGEDI